jgi:hypothetical protein
MTADRVYSVLLVAYPRPFRREYGERMVAAFRELHREAHHTPLAFWYFIVVDLARSSMKQRSAAIRSLVPLRRGWFLTCAAGALSLIAAAHVFSWSYAYLYHPYLEGLPAPAWLYGGVLGASVGLAQPRWLGRRRRSQAAWMITSAAAGALGLHVAAAFSGAIMCGTMLGTVVGSAQWLVLRLWRQRATWWAGVIATAVSAAAVTSVNTIRATLGGMDAVPVTPAPLPAIVAMTPNTMHTGALFAIVAMVGLLSAALSARLLSRFFTREMSC